MILEKSYERTAKWGTTSWIVYDRPRYRWTDMRGRAITEWYDLFDDALQFAVESGTRLGATGTRNQN